MIGPKKVEWTPIAHSASSSSGMLCEQQAGGADDHDEDLGGLDDADDARLVAGVGELAGERREQEEGQDEQPAGDRAERRFLGRVAIDAVDDQHDHRGAEQIVVERAEELGREDRQEAARAQQMGDVLARVSQSFRCAAASRAAIAAAIASGKSAYCEPIGEARRLG